MISTTEKAIDLITKFKNFAHTPFDSTTGYQQNELHRNAKSCASLLVVEMLKELNCINEPDRVRFIRGEDELDEADDVIIYWHDVLIEIEKQ